ncbi:hypothetical protein Y032_0015g2581 [Ancylostoma ceylanicum]|uniref:Uncharacterized protein n=1 Tax=Ancylostoma ceylanicum TaxID=53326 RepID=A0A016V6K3_9BILA|nr:hypothetical protein Y032_0015g2581 [Ancylostoma ceylanicum]
MKRSFFSILSLSSLLVLFRAYFTLSYSVIPSLSEIENAFHHCWVLVSIAQCFPETAAIQNAKYDTLSAIFHGKSIGTEIDANFDDNAFRYTSYGV